MDNKTNHNKFKHPDETYNKLEVNNKKRAWNMPNWFREEVLSEEIFRTEWNVIKTHQNLWDEVKTVPCLRNNYTI